MPALIAALVSAVGVAISYLVKHPFVLKMMLFPLFIAVILYAVNWFVDWLMPYLSGVPALGYAAYFGALDGISLYLTIITAGFLVRQVLRFVATT